MYQEGQTATHKDGRKIVFRGGQWVNAGQSATGAPAVTAKRLGTREQMALDEARAAARQADEAARTAEQFVDLNRKQPSGELWSIPGVAKVAGAFDPEIAQMNALTARMAPQQRVPGSGTTSDRDLSLYLQSVPGMTQPGPANSAIARQARQDAKRRQDYANFLDTYAAERGTLIGAEQAWQQQSRGQGGAQRPAGQAPKPSGGFKIISVE